MDDAEMPIGRFARLNGLSLHTLRYYDEVGLLHPERADVILMLKAGRIVERGTADELIAKKGEFFTMFESQI